MAAILECVPNFSEGVDLETIGAIASAVEGVEGVKLLHTDRGAGAGRTVFTFAGAPAAVVEAAYSAVAAAAERIDMRRHHGSHPRIGAADVVPLVPVSGISLDEVVPMARDLGRRIGEELGIPVFLYEAASPTGRRLEQCRAGEYEGLRNRLSEADFGPREWNERVAQTGASVVGARNFLVAVNFSLSTDDLSVAKQIAAAIRKQRALGTISGIKAIGWVIEEYGLAQVSTNLTDIDAMPIAKAWTLVKQEAERIGVEVVGTELIGLVPDRALAGADLPAMRFDRHAPFDLDRRIIERML